MTTHEEIVEVVFAQYLKRAEVFAAAPSIGNYQELEFSMIAYQAVVVNEQGFFIPFVEGKPEPTWIFHICSVVKFTKL